MSDGLPRVRMEGYLHLDVYRAGALIEQWEDKNLITDLARPRIRDMMSSETENKFITHIGVGEGMLPASPTDTGLVNQILVPVTAVTKPDSTTARFGFVIDLETANGMRIREFGLFCGDGTMFSKRVRERVIEKDADVSIFGYWDIHF